MNQRHQILTDDEGKPAFAVIPRREYKALGLDAMLSDEALYDRGKAEAGEDLPLHVIKRLADGEPPTLVYREHRGISKLNQSFLKESLIESPINAIIVFLITDREQET